MALNAKNEFRVLSENSENVQTSEEFDTDEDRKLGFQPGQVIVSKKVNTALKQNSLIVVALVDALMKEDSPTLSIASTVEDLISFFKNSFSNLQSTRKKQNRLFATASSIESEWNTTYDIITLQTAGTYNFTFNDINDNIKQSYECVVITQAGGVVLSFPTGSAILQLNKFNCTIGDPANTITLPTASTYIVEVVVINSQTYEVTILDYNGAIAHVIQQFTITTQDGTNLINSNNATNPTFNLKLTNPNTVNVNYVITGDLSKSGVANASTDTIVSGSATSLKDSYTFNFAFTADDYFESSQTSTFTTKYTVDACNVVADGTDDSNSRTITVTAPTLSNSATYKIYYKIWWEDEEEPVEYTMIQTSPATVTRTNSTYSNRVVKVKQYVEMYISEVLKATSEVKTTDINIKGREIPTLTSPTVDYRSRGYCGTGTLTINVTNPNSVTVNVYARAGAGSYTNVGTITANSNSNFTLTGVANSAGTVYAYLTAVSYNNSGTGSDSYPACTNPCDCVSYVPTPTVDCVDVTSFTATAIGGNFSLQSGQGTASATYEYTNSITNKVTVRIRNNASYTVSYSGTVAGESVSGSLSAGQSATLTGTTDSSSCSYRIVTSSPGYDSCTTSDSMFNTTTSMSIFVYSQGYCPSGGGTCDIDKVTGDTNYCSYDISRGSSRCSNCKPTGTSFCAIADLCPVSLTNINWDENISF